MQTCSSYPIFCWRSLASTLKRSTGARAMCKLKAKPPTSRAAASQRFPGSPLAEEPKHPQSISRPRKAPWYQSQDTKLPELRFRALLSDSGPEVRFERVPAG